ncbi:MAG: hypothetical protein P8X95_28530 [Anaerolineales bacterium]
MTNGATAGNEVQTQSYNPWHHMKGIQKSVRIPGTILPKRWLRPYFYDHPYRIDDKQYVIASISSLKDGLHFVYGSLYLLAGGVALEWAATLFRGEFEPWMILICLVIAIPLQKYGKTLKRDRFDIYDREKGTVRREYGWFKRKYHEMTFWDSEAYLVSGSNHMGLMRHMLFLFHPSGQSFMVTEGADYDWPLGYWSFLLQYMDKNKPLPDILSLKKYPDKEPGLGDWKSWKEKIAKREVIDPYLVWETQLAKHPEWDVGNYGRDLSKSWRPQFYFALSIFTVLILIGTLIAYFTI